MPNDDRRQASDAIEVTPEMIEAGLDVLYEFETGPLPPEDPYGDECTPSVEERLCVIEPSDYEGLLKRLYRAMAVSTLSASDEKINHPE